MEPLTSLGVAFLAQVMATATYDLIKDYRQKEKLGKDIYLKNGSKHELVEKVQHALVSKGANLVIDGIYGRTTQLEVLRFQANHDLRADGVCGPVTLLLLLENKRKEGMTTKGSYPDSVVVQRGSRGVITKAVQTALVEFGYKIDPDGIFGKGTDSAIRRFQENHGLSVDGKCGVATFAILFKKS